MRVFYFLHFTVIKAAIVFIFAIHYLGYVVTNIHQSAQQ